MWTSLGTISQPTTGTQMDYCPAAFPYYPNTPIFIALLHLVVPPKCPDQVQSSFFETDTALLWPLCSVTPLPTGEVADRVPERPADTSFLSAELMHCAGLVYPYSRMEASKSNRKGWSKKSLG